MASLSRRGLSIWIALGVMLSSTEARVSHSIESNVTLESLVSQAQLIAIARRVKSKTPFDSEPFEVVEILLGPPSLKPGSRLTVYSSMHDFNLAVAEEMAKNKAAGRMQMQGIPGMIINSYPSSVTDEKYHQTQELILFLRPFHEKPDEFQFVEMGAFESVARKSQVLALIAQRAPR